MRLDKLIDICDAYARLGGSVQEQLASVLDGESLEEQNSNALVEIRRFLAVAHNVGIEDPDDVAVKIDGYLHDLEQARDALNLFRP